MAKRDPLPSIAELLRGTENQKPVNPETPPADPPAPKSVIAESPKHRKAELRHRRGKPKYRKTEPQGDGNTEKKISRSTEKLVPSEEDPQPDAELVKVTVYLHPTTADRIDDALFAMKRKARPAKVLKADLVEALLRYALDELERGGAVADMIPRKSRKEE